jgi:hypothetical protein
MVDWLPIPTSQQHRKGPGWGQGCSNQTDNGSNWTPTRGQPGGSSFTHALAVDSAGRIFIGTLKEGLWRSVDGGASWRNVLSEQFTIFGLLAGRAD